MTKLLGILAMALVIAAGAARLTAQPQSGPDAVYDAIRSGDIGRLKTLVSSAATANAAGMFGNTPLMNAAVAGSTEAMAYLIGAGADVNAQNAFGTTALMMAATQAAKVRLLLDHGAQADRASKQGRTALFIAAMSADSAPIVRMLVAGGADLKTKDGFQNTTLTAAAYGNDLETLRLCLDAGIDVNAAGVTGVTPLLGAAYNGNLAAVRLLLSKGAKVNAVAQMPTLFPVDAPKSGPISLTEVTPLLAAAADGSTELIEALLDAGADVNARDGRGMTPLMLAVATNHQNPAAIRLLLARGADTTLQSKAGERAADWARKLARPAGLELLKVAAPPSVPTAAQAALPAHVDVKTAAERGIALLEASSQKFFEGSGCVSCHHQNAAGLAAGEARTKGLRFDAAASAARVEMLKQGPPPPLLLERMDINVPEIFASAMIALASEGVPPNPVSDIIAANLAATQSADGSWPIQNGIGARPPAEEGAITRVAMCVRSLKVYGAPGRAAEMDARIAKARQWLLAAAPLTRKTATCSCWASTGPARMRRC